MIPSTKFGKSHNIARNTVSPSEPTSTIKCCACGRFIGYREMYDGGATFHFEPDSHRGPEISEWTCERCGEGGRD